MPDDYCGAVKHDDGVYGIHGCTLQPDHSGPHLCYKHDCAHTWVTPERETLADSKHLAKLTVATAGLFCSNCGHLKEFDREHECPKANAWDVILTQAKRIAELAGENGVLANDLSSADQELERVVVESVNLEQQLAAAREAVEKAPHSIVCSMGRRYLDSAGDKTEPQPCNCWKRDTLALLKGE